MADGTELLRGTECSAVCFVRDYVELHFDGPVLRCISDPSGVTADGSWRFPDRDSIAVMRSFIGRTVTGVVLTEEHLSLEFDAGAARWTVPLDEQSRVGAEAAHIMGAAGSADLWIY